MAEYDAVDDIAREFSAIRKELDNYADIWYNAKNGVLIAATQENIRAFLEADVDLLDCFEGHYYDLKKKLSDLCVEIEPSEDAKKRKLLRSDVLICPGCDKLVAFATSFIEFSKQIFDDDIDDGGEAAYEEDEEFVDDLLVHEDHVDEDHSAEEPFVDDLLVHEDLVDEDHSAEEPYKWAVFSELITEETGVGRNCECPRHSEDENGIIKYYVPLDELKYWDGAEEKSAKKVLKIRPCKQEKEEGDT